MIGTTIRLACQSEGPLSCRLHQGINLVLAFTRNNQGIEKNQFWALQNGKLWRVRTLAWGEWYTWCIAMILGYLQVVTAFGKVQDSAQVRGRVRADVWPTLSNKVASRPSTHSLELPLVGSYLT